MKISGILLDRDGVINRERVDYVKELNEFEFLPGVLMSLQRLASLSVPILVITNQSVIGRGIIDWNELSSIHAHLQKVVKHYGGRIDNFYVCPHHPDEQCLCRKPKPGLLLQAAEDYQLLLKNCVFIGDSITDFQAAQAAGCNSILIRSGIQGRSLEELSTHLNNKPPILSDLSEAVSLILRLNRQNLDNESE